MAEKRETPHPGFMPARVVHLHPSRRCNLTCQHCYSSSGPDERGELSAESVIAALAVFRAEGYEVLSLSGGEPLLYTRLEELLRGATSLGYRVNLITNGAALGGRLLDLVGEHVSMLAVSLDGAPETHNRLRGDPRAFGWVERAADRLSATGIRFGLSYCVSRESLGDMPWAAEFAAKKGAAMLQFHPFGSAGRGRSVSSGLRLGRTEAARAFLTAKLLEASAGPAIKIDLVLVDQAIKRWEDYKLLVEGVTPLTPLAELVNPLVIDDTGLILPFSYGIHRRLAVAHLNYELKHSIARLKTSGAWDVRTLLRRAFTCLNAKRGEFVDWFQHIVETSTQLGTEGDRESVHPALVTLPQSSAVAEGI